MTQTTTKLDIKKYSLGFPCKVAPQEKPPFTYEDHFWLCNEETGEGMSVSPTNLEKQLDELWKDF